MSDYDSGRPSRPSKGGGSKALGEERSPSAKSYNIRGGHTNTKRKLDEKSVKNCSGTHENLADGGDKTSGSDDRCTQNNVETSVYTTPKKIKPGQGSAGRYSNGQSSRTKRGLKNSDLQSVCMAESSSDKADSFTSEEKDNGNNDEAQSSKCEKESSSSKEASMLANGISGVKPGIVDGENIANGDQLPRQLSFKVVSNDCSDGNLIWLINIKEIFAKQLPKMPQEYIVRLVMDKKHFSLIAIRDGQVVGGVCFRPYLSQRFAEIAFLAVSATHQVRGIGSMIMNHLKEYVKTIGLTHFLTYADNYAIGYFRKQGFTKYITMPKERWRNYIKDYDGGTLMECAINEYVDYLSIPKMISSQRVFLQERIQEAAHSSIVRPGLRIFESGKVIHNLVEQVPGINEAGWGTMLRGAMRTVPCVYDSGESRGPEVEKEFKAFMTMYDLFRQVKNHKDAWPFQEPVSDSVTDYLEIVSDPIDLTLIKKRLEHGRYYKNRSDLQADFLKMCDNSILYNHRDTPYAKAAVSLKTFITELFS